MPSGQGLQLVKWLRLPGNLAKLERALEQNPPIVDEMEDGERIRVPTLSVRTGWKILPLLADSHESLPVMSEFHHLYGVEWAYVIDLDDNVFEIYQCGKRFEMSPVPRRFDRMVSWEDLDAGLELLKSYQLDNLPTEGQLLALEHECGFEIDLGSTPGTDDPDVEEYAQDLGEDSELSDNSSSDISLKDDSEMSSSPSGAGVNIDNPGKRKHRDDVSRHPLKEPKRANQTIPELSNPGLPLPERLKTGAVKASGKDALHVFPTWYFALLDIHSSCGRQCPSVLARNGENMEEATPMSCGAYMEWRHMIEMGLARLDDWRVYCSDPLPTFMQINKLIQMKTGSTQQSQLVTIAVAVLIASLMQQYGPGGAMESERAEIVSLCLPTLEQLLVVVEDQTKKGSSYMSSWDNQSQYRPLQRCIYNNAANLGDWRFGHLKQELDSDCIKGIQRALPPPATTITNTYYIMTLCFVCELTGSDGVFFGLKQHFSRRPLSSLINNWPHRT
jgi:hypothetical protein